ncbi:HECT-type E3 ubiquitin transferase [Ranunculus cassubicifolius]
MTTLRSSLPSRLRQLLAGEGAVGPSLKLESEPPPAIKAFIDKVITSPLHDIAIPLSGFRWEYNKGNFHHWRPLFLHFDTYFKTYLSCRKDLLLSDNMSDDALFPKHDVLQILRVMQTVLENCHNKSSFGGLEHFKYLLASTDSDVLIATLETLSALVKINPSKLHVSGKLVGCGSINSCLLSLAQGWGSKEEGLGLYSCVVANEKTQEEGLSLFPSDLENECGKSQYRLGSTLCFEFHGVNPQASEDTSKSSNLCVIHIPDLHLRKEDDLLLLKQCVEQYNVPPEHRFSLLTRIRYARAFRSSKTCRLYSRICLLAFIVLVQSNDAHDELVSFFANEPEYTNELIRIVRSEESIPGNIRTLAMLALAAQLAAYSSSHDRARILSGSSIISAGGNRMILLNVLQKAVLSLNVSSNPSSLSFVEALLQFYLLHVISSSSSGSAIRGSGMVPTLLPLLQDASPTHIHLVGFAVKALQKLMDYSNAAVTLFKDLGGVELLTQRLQTEVNRVIGEAGPSDKAMVIGELQRFDDDRLYLQKRLIKALLKALGSATYAPANATRSHNSHDNSLPGSLSLIFRNVERFGGDIYFSAVTVMSEIIHKDPTCFTILHELGLPEAFLSSVVAGILPSSKAITCVPSGLGAICLNAKGLEAVKDTMALRFLVDIFTTRRYVLAMNEGVVPLANSVEELLRHVSSLRGTGVDIIIEIIEKLASLGDDAGAGTSEKGDASNAMETDAEDRENEGQSSLVNAMSSTADGINNERFVQLCIFHVMVLVHRTMENSETCRMFVEKKGIEALMRLLLRPSIAQSSEGMSIALHSTVVFKNFTQHHSAPLAHAFCSFLRDHLKKALTGFSSASGSFLLAPKTTPDKSIFSSLFIVEFLLFLAASKENRWVTALLTEFGNGSKDVLEDIGRLHREVLWQISLLDDSKLDMEESSSGSAADSQKPEATSNETEEQRFNSLRVLDPSSRRRNSGWSVESQFFDLLNLYRDLGRATGGQQRFSMDGHFNSRLGSGHQLHRAGSSDVASISRLEGDKERSYYSSCCDMMRSLSFHINHLFLELGKVMLLPSRRRDDSLNVSPTSRSVVSTFASIALDHLNFGGHVDPSKSDVSISSKCRYLGKVIDFIDGILLDRPDSCNPILVNCFYGHGVIQSVLTTFEATSQLPFAVNRAPTSPMETDDGNSKLAEKEETDYSWIYGPLASYGTLMDHLATSSFVLSPFTKHLLAQPLSNGNISFPRDAETFVKVLQSMVLKAVLPIWTHPHFTDCSHEFITTILSILRHIYSGVEVKNVNSSVVTRTAGPPPNETTISMIVEMGFTRSRAEEALRQVGTNSVELAMEWLFSHPEEVQEDDELARALAMSLGSSETTTTDENVTDAVTTEQEEEMVQLPPVDELLSTCMRLLHVKEPLAFPVRDFLVMICSQNDGQDRSKVISFIIDHVKLCSSISDEGNSTMLSALFHVLALVLHEDAVAREVASKNGLVTVTSDLLSQWDPSSSGENVPKWVTAAFLAIDRLLQVDPKLNPDLSEQLKKDDPSNREAAVVIEEEKSKKSQSTLGVDSLHINLDEQKRLVDIACRCIRNQLPSETMHVVLQLCATLTRTHSVAVNFLEAGGLPSLLSLPTRSLFSGYDSVASTIVRHILEDPQTLQQAMESEIRHSLVAATNRHANGRGVTPRNFLLNLASVVSRDPVVFMQAAKSVCQIEMVGERPYVVLLKDREKEKSKDKEKDKASDKDKQPTADVKTMSSDINSVAPGNAHGKIPDSNPKSVKVHRKPPPSFTSVIELLLDSVVTYVPSSKDDGVIEEVVGSSTVVDMDIDDAANKGKGKAVATVPEQGEKDPQEDSASLAKTVFILKLLTEILLTYSSSVHVLLRRDSEVANYRGIHQKGHPGSGSGGIFHHILHKFLPYTGKKEKKGDGDWRQKLTTRASQFLVASCVRSVEGRKRVFTEINTVFNDFVDSSDGFKPPNNNVHAFIDLLNEILGARSPTGSYISAEASATFIDVGLVRSLTRTLQILDLDHADSPKVATGLVKALEVVTKEHVHSSDPSSGKGENAAKPPEQNQSERIEASENRFQSLESTQDEEPTDHIEPFNAVQASGSSDSNADDMDHDRDLDGGFAPGTEDDFMHETSDDARGLENGIESVGIRFEIQHNGQDNLDEDDDDMSGDEGDEVDEEEDDDDDEENHDLEEDEVHHMSHPDTDQDDHEIDEDEFDEDMLEEEEDEDEDDEDGVILRLEEGINGINVFDHIEVFGRDNSFPNDALHVMPVEVFGSRRQGRTTSIYNLLGRTGDNGATSQHPLLTEPSSTLHPSLSRLTDNAGDAIFPERSLDNVSSRLDTIFRSLRNGRHGHRFNMWTDDSQQRPGSNAPTIPPGLEELLVSQLRRPSPEKSENEKSAMDSQAKVETNELDVSEAGARVESHVDNVAANESLPLPPSNPELIVGAGNPDTRSVANEFLEVMDATAPHTQSDDLQFERNDAVVRDVEAVSQESGGSGATLGESLRSLDVEIGSADGHDDGGERQASIERLPLGDLQASRMRRSNAPNAIPASSRDASLQSVSEVSENAGQEAGQDAVTEEQQINREADSGSIDPAFLDALPEELRAEVLSTQHGQVAQPPNPQPQSAEEIDPEFLAALPPDIRAEVLAQQQVQRLQQSQELEGQPVEMDTVSIIATFPSELREEVLLTSSDAILANLTPALVAEANMLRERFAHRYHSRTLFGMYPRNRRGESSRRGEAVGSGLGRGGGSNASRRSAGGKIVEADGAPLVDTEGLKGMIRLLRVVQPLYKGMLQKLLLNLCAHQETRAALGQILMEMLLLDTRKRAGLSSVGGEPSFRLYACQNYVMYSRPQFSDGVPPLVSRRVLETLTYLARSHPYVAKLLLQLELPSSPVHELQGSDPRGKAVMLMEEDNNERKGDVAIILLLSLLNQPLYLRSIAHLEQLLNLLEVIIDSADQSSSLSDKPGETPTEQPSVQQSAISDAEMNSDAGASAAAGDVKLCKTEEVSNPSSSGAVKESEANAVLLNLPQGELRLLCSLLAREGLSDNAYVLVAEVLKKLVAIAPVHCLLFITELADSIKNLTGSAMDELHIFGEAEKALLSTTSTDGTAILRVLQALSSLVSSLQEKDVQKEQGDALSQVWDINASLEPLWLELSTCISKIEAYTDCAPDAATASRSSSSTAAMPPLPAGTQNILPYIESFFVTCEKLHPGQSGVGQELGAASTSDGEDVAASTSQQKPAGITQKVDEKHVAFVKFSEKHRKLLNAFIRQNPGLLEKSFTLMLKVPRFIDFDNKRSHFRSKIKHQHDHHHSPLRISVRRAYILEDSYNQLRMRSTQDLKGRLTVHFQGEEGIDAGGLTREWYQLLSRVIFDKGALLFTTVGNDSTFQPNPNSVYQTEHLSYFKFVGRVVGKALFDGQLLDVHFTRSFYKHILGVKVTYHDIEAIDPDYFKNLKWMLENDISDILDLTFSMDADEEKLILYEKTEVTDYELIPGGRNIRVTEENKHEYVDLVAEHRLTTAIRPQINAFMDGFNELIPRELISIFNDKELELLISGLPDIDLDDMRANTEYSGYSAGSPVIQWFWEVAQGFSKEDKARLLQFVTGTSKVPLEGFSALQGISGSQRFQIHKAYGSADHLPSAHTCFNQLDLPEYPSKQHLEERLLLAIHEANEGFGFG